jgi:hypothetical protein
VSAGPPIGPPIGPPEGFESFELEDEGRYEQHDDPRFEATSFEVPDEEVAGGIMPPPGPLPQTFGPPRWILWSGRLAIAGIVLTTLTEQGQELVDKILDATSWVEILVPASAALLFILRRMSRVMGRRKDGEKDRISAISVVLDVSGVGVMTAVREHRFAWGELVGLVAPDDEHGGWTLRMQRGRERVFVDLPSADWAERLAAALRGEPIDKDERFER